MVSILIAAAANSLRVRNAAKRLQHWWFEELWSRKEKEAALVIERFFIFVKKEVEAIDADSCNDGSEAQSNGKETDGKCSLTLRALRMPLCRSYCADPVLCCIRAGESQTVDTTVVSTQHDAVPNEVIVADQDGTQDDASSVLDWGEMWKDATGTSLPDTVSLHACRRAAFVCSRSTLSLRLPCRRLFDNHV